MRCLELRSLCISLKIITHHRTFVSQSDSSIQRPRSISCFNVFSCWDQWNVWQLKYKHELPTQPFVLSHDDIANTFLLITMLLKCKPRGWTCMTTIQPLWGFAKIVTEWTQWPWRDNDEKCTLLWRNIQQVCSTKFSLNLSLSLEFYLEGLSFQPDNDTYSLGSNCTSSPHSCWPPASTPEAVSEHSCRSRGKTFNWNKKRQRTHNINCCILCVYITI